MEENEPAYQKRGVPRIITIKGIDLFYKEPPLKNDIYVYRCRKSHCKYFIRINKTNIDKVLNKESGIQYIEVNEHTGHEDNSGKNVENIGSEEIRTEKETFELAIKLIKSNITESMEFHLQNFNQNKIYWKKSKIRKMVYNIREQKFPKEEEFLNSIKLITIKLNDHNNYDELFCPAKGEYINYRKNNKLEKYVIFMSEFQINYFTEIEEIFIDGTFKVAPKNWYQLLNIFGYNKKQNFYMPLAYIILNSKSEEIYNEVFYKIIQLIKYHTNLKSFEDIKIMSDFEIGLRKAIKKNFELCLLDGCYFHYCKAIWKKIKKLNLFKKKLRYNTIIIFFVMKVYPYIKTDKREKYYEKLEIFAENLGDNYIKLLKYFKKYWKDCELFNFTNLNNKIIENRTNNICESFHHKLNKKISHFHPKMSFLVDGLKKITKEYYDDYISVLSKVKKKEYSHNYIAKDIFNFVKKFVVTSKENFDLDTLIQNVANDGENFYRLIKDIFEKISDESDNIIDNIRNVLIKNNILKANDDNVEEIEEEEGDDIDEENKGSIGENFNNIEDSEDQNKVNINIKNKINQGDIKHLINGDVIIEQKIEERKHKKRKPTESKNMLDELEI